MDTLTRSHTMTRTTWLRSSSCSSWSEARGRSRTCRRVAQLQVVRGRLDRESLAGLIEDFERTGLIVQRGASAGAYELMPAGRSIVDAWVAIMRDRRRLSRTFLALYDRTDE